MLSKKFRLTAAEFHKNPNTAKRFSCFYLTLLAKTSGSSCSRFVILTPKSLNKRSVCRHKTKRAITEAIRALLGKMKRGYDVRLKAKKIIRKEDKVIVEKEITNLFKRAGLI